MPGLPTATDGVRQESCAEAGSGPKGLLFDLAGIDLSARVLSKQQIERWNPHRGAMAMLDWVVWQAADYTRTVGLKHVRTDEFWVQGHFPERAMLPGVLMLEAGAQLASYAFTVRQKEPKLAAFARIESAAFRAAVAPGADLYLLCQQVKFQPRRFISDIMGLVNGQIAFDARITGIAIG